MSGTIPAPPMNGDIRKLSDKEFALFRDLIHREAGIHLSPAKRALLVGRLSKRLRELGLRSFGEYYACVTDKKGRDEKVRMLERMCTHETHFFREGRQFDFLEQSVFPEWEALAARGRRPRGIRVWSAGCSRGQEPYSLAMLLLSRFPPHSGWGVDIVATDLSTQVLAQAKRATWPIEKADEIPPAYLKRFMLQGTRSQEGQMKAGREIRSVVRFRQLNLNDKRYALQGPFDLIFCRNVLIYFSDESRRAVVHRFLDLLASDGYLFLGHAETLNRLTDRVRSVGPMAYARPAQPLPVTVADG